MKLILASTSPRRSELLTQAGLEFEVVALPVDESPQSDEAPDLLVRRLALLKAKAVASRRPDAWVIGGDTVVVIDSLILSKPLNASEARQTLKRIQGRTHEVWTGVALLNQSSNQHAVEAHRASVKICALDDETIRAYVATEEPLDKAGSYAIQGLGSQFVEEINGCYSTVVGLTLPPLMRMLRNIGIMPRWMK